MTSFRPCGEWEKGESAEMRWGWGKVRSGDGNKGPEEKRLVEAFCFLLLSFLSFFLRSLGFFLAFSPTLSPEAE